jgi:DNA-binding GntR family transcriptional regulator
LALYSVGNSLCMFPSADIVRALEEDIVFGICHPKQRLTEDGLMARFNLKRHLVRDALRQLDAMGLVVRVPNRGAFVRELTPKEATEIYEIREILKVAATLRTPLPCPQRSHRSSSRNSREAFRGHREK